MNYYETSQAILANGGITVSLNGTQPFFGYAYALDCCEARYDIHSFGSYELAGYVQAHYRRLVKPGNYLGAWLDDDDVVLDVSRIEFDLDRAIRVSGGARSISCLRCRDG